jgi:hypothetical protein
MQQGPITIYNIEEYYVFFQKFNLKLGRITGLDPAAPYFSKTVTLVRLDRSDAKYVDIIHTNAIPLYMSGNYCYYS